ncbi:MAG: hypothetical protein ACKO5M_04855 [Vulcanococcus sp.]
MTATITAAREQAIERSADNGSGLEATGINSPNFISGVIKVNLSDWLVFGKLSHLLPIGTVAAKFR